MREDLNTMRAWAAQLGQRRGAARKPQSARPALEAMEDRLVPAMLDLTTVGAAGFYAFDGLAAGNYTLIETPPSGFTNDGVFVGSQNSGTIGAAGIFNIVLQSNTNGINNDFLNVLAAS